MQIETVAVLMLGGAWDQDELSDNDIAPCDDVIESMQQRLVKGYQDVHIELVDRAHVDRVTAERDALQQLLNARDEEVENLRDLLRSMTCSYHEAITNGHERIVSLGGECDSPERMLNDNPAYAKSWETLENQA